MLGGSRGARVLFAVLVVSAGVAWGGAPPAEAAAACTVNATFGYAPGLTVVPAPIPVVTGTLVLNCPVLTPDAGLWVLPFTGVSPLESCESGVGTALFGPATIGPAGFGGTVVYGHGPGGVSSITAVMTWPGNTRSFASFGIWAPILVPDNCVAPAATSAFFTGAGAFA